MAIMASTVRGRQHTDACIGSASLAFPVMPRTTPDELHKCCVVALGEASGEFYGEPELLALREHRRKNPLLIFGNKVDHSVKRVFI